MQTSPKNLPIIGNTEPISIGSRLENIPAKIDTGADSSAIWASHIRVSRDGVLRFHLFGEGSKYYTGKVFKRTDFEAAKVISSNGTSNIRYRTYFTVKLADRKIRIRFYLSDRSHNRYPVLIGRRSIRGKFLVDVARSAKKIKVPPKPFHGINEELKKNPYKFHKKYVKIKK